MPDTYAYKVRDREGKILQGSLEAESTTLVANKLREMGFVPIAIDKKSSSSLQKEITIPGFAPKASRKDIAVFSRQFAVMINSGLSLLRSLSILGEQSENKALKDVVVEVRNDVEKGSSLSQALARHPKVFNRLYVSMVRAGETGGVLDSVLLQLAATIEKQVELRGKIRSAMTYPIAVLCLVTVILIAMLVFIVPTFKTLYDDLGGTLPLPTRILLGVSAIIKGYFPFVVLGAIGFVFAFKRWKATPKGRATYDRLILKGPIFGGLVQKTAITRFARTFGVLLRSGVPILESLEITAETVNNVVVEDAVRDVQSAVRTGESIASPLSKHDIFPPMVTQMIAVGEETGALDEMLEKIADFYDAEIEATVDALTSLLEPLLIVVLGGAVGSMVIALYMPMFNIINLIE